LYAALRLDSAVCSWPVQFSLRYQPRAHAYPGAPWAQPVMNPGYNRLVDDALAAGVNHIDAAPTYGNCEVLFGKALAGRRNEVFLASKTTKRDKAGAAEELHKSLERLQTDHLDLYQMHGLDDRRRLRGLRRGPRAGSRTLSWHHRSQSC